MKEVEFDKLHPSIQRAIKYSCKNGYHVLSMLTSSTQLDPPIPTQQVCERCYKRFKYEPTNKQIVD